MDYLKALYTNTLNQLNEFSKDTQSQFEEFE